MNKVILNRIQFLNIIYNCLTRIRYEFLYKIISAQRHTDTNETCGTERIKENIPVEVCEVGTGVDDVVGHIKHILLGDTLGEDGGLSL